MWAQCEGRRLSRGVSAGQQRCPSDGVPDAAHGNGAAVPEDTLFQ